MRDHHRVLMCLAFAMLALSATAIASEIVVVIDQTGRVVHIEQPVGRIACVYGSGTFYLYTLGVQDRLVAAWYVGLKNVSQASAAMLRLEPRLEELLLFGDPNVEEFVARGAQLVLVDGSRHAAFAEQMGELDVSVLQYLVETPAALKEAIQLTGTAFGSEARARADAFVGDHERVLGTVREDLVELRNEDRARVLFLGTSSLLVASGDMYQTDLIEAAGGLSVSSTLFGYWNEVSLEQVLLWNPDVIIIPPYGPVQPVDLLDDPDWQAIRAVSEGRVHRMPRLIAPMDTPVPESILGVVWMATLLYPDLLSLDLAGEMKHFYASYYGLVLTEDELALLSAR
jgi:iron complex transport system substrate-binding protein